jgi:pheromone shutdown protein TraB
MSKKYKDFISTSLSIEDKEKRIKEFRKLMDKVNADKMYKKGFQMGVVFSIISMFMILGVVYIANHYEFIF